MLCVAVIKHHDLVGGKCLFQLTVYGPLWREVRLEAGTKAETMAGWLPMLSLPRDGSIPSGLDPFPSISNQENTRHTPLQAATQPQLYKDIFSVEVPSSQTTLACAKLMKY